MLDFESQVLILRSIVHSKDLDEFCRTLPLIIHNSSMSCTIRQLKNTVEVPVIASSDVLPNQREIEYPPSIRDFVIKRMIGNNPSLFLVQGNIWCERKFEDYLVAKESIVWLIPAAEVMGFTTWLDFRWQISDHETTISKLDTNFLQWALYLGVCFNSNKRRHLDLVPNIQQSVDFNPRGFTRRQERIFDFACEGMSNSQIAQQLRISNSLVKLEMSKIFKLCNVKKRSELFDLSLSSGL